MLLSLDTASTTKEMQFSRLNPNVIYVKQSNIYTVKEVFPLNIKCNFNTETKSIFLFSNV